jgi:hypothetical protein
LQGPVMPGRQLAKMAVALQMCQFLHKEGKYTYQPNMYMTKIKTEMKHFRSMGLVESSNIQ